MTRVLLGILLLPLLPTLLAAAPAAGAVSDPPRPVRGDRLVERIERLPLVASAQEGKAPGSSKGRFFRIKVRLPVDHRDPEGPTFRLRMTLLHVGHDRPMVLSASGYQVSSWTFPYRGQLAELVNGNEIQVEHRFFGSSRPARPDWPTQLTVEQSARDQHRIVQAFRRLYRKPWVSTGASKGGMTMTYHRRFFPGDVAGTVALVAPNDAVDEDDRYDQFLSEVGGDDFAWCRARWISAQRRILGEDRAWFTARLERFLDDSRLTTRWVGGVDRLLETTVLDAYFSFWQYAGRRGCRDVPQAEAGNRELFELVSRFLGWSSYTDQGVRPYVPYYYQAALELGSPEPWEEPVADLLQHPGSDVAESLLPPHLRPVPHDPEAMADVDAWVRSKARRILFIYGEDDPWSAEPFACGPGAGSRECVRFVDPAGVHGSGISSLPRTSQRTAIRMVRRWAGLTTTRAQLPAIERRIAVGAAREDRHREHLRRVPAGHQPRPHP